MVKIDNLNVMHLADMADVSHEIARGVLQGRLADCVCAQCGYDGAHCDLLIHYAKNDSGFTEVLCRQCSNVFFLGGYNIKFITLETWKRVQETGIRLGMFTDVPLKWFQPSFVKSNATILYK